MNVKNIIGKKILDKNVKEVGKIADLTFDVKTFKLTSVYGSLGNPINKKYFQLKSENILAIGDYLQISDVLEDIEENIIDKIPNDDELGIKVNDLLGIKVIDSNANETGKISDIEIDLDKQTITDIKVSKSSSFGRSEEITVDINDINALGNYLLINKELDFEKNDEEKADEGIEE